MESLINTGRSESFVDLNETDLALSRSVLNQGRDMFMSYQGKIQFHQFHYSLTSNFRSLSSQVMASTVPKVWLMNRSVERPNSMESVSFAVCISANCQFSTFPFTWGTFTFQRKRHTDCLPLWFNQQIRCCLLFTLYPIRYFLFNCDFYSEFFPFFFK